MSFRESNTSLITNLFIRFILGAIFIISGWAKLSTPVYYFAHSVDQFQLLPEWVTVLTSYTLPWIELLCGVCLILGLFTEGAALIIDVMLAFFIFAVTRATLKGIHAECGCFGFLSNSEIGWKLVIQDVFLFLIGLFFLFTHSGFLTLESLLRRVKGSFFKRR